MYLVIVAYLFNKVNRPGIELSCIMLFRSLVFTNFVAVEIGARTRVRPSVIQATHWNATLNLPPGEYSKQWEDVQLFRRRQVERVCLHRGVSRRPVRPTFQMLVDVRHKVMFCYVPKAACTSWKAVLCQLIKEGVRRTTEELLLERKKDNWPGEDIHYFLQSCGLKHMDKLTETEIAEVMTNYTKFMAVRHPIERLISLYRQKLYTTPENPHSDCHLCKSLGTRLLKKYRANPSEESLVTGRGVTQEEFFRHLIKNNELNEHWTEYSLLCHPCEINYDYILKTETMDVDAAQVIRRVYNSTLPFLESNPTNVSHVTKTRVSEEVNRDLLKRYDIDMDLFGYE